MKYYQKEQTSHRAIKQFNRVCAEERIKCIGQRKKKEQKVVGNYLIQTFYRLGQGTFSKVFKGKDIRNQKEVAVKVVQIRTIQKMGIQKLFWEEVNIIQQLKHPNIVACFQHFRTPNNCYTIYEFCKGGDLLSLIKKGRFQQKQDLQEANNYIKDVFHGLLYLESISIVHRDIKAANILINGGRAKIGDFGFATRSKGEFKDASIGSPAYMAPQGLLDNVYGPKTDVWGFGMLLYQMLHGTSPFHQCQSQKQLRCKILVPINWDQLRGNLPSPLKRLILKCLKVDVDERPSMSDLLTDEYIQKLYNSMPKYYNKSVTSKVTADSQQEGIDVLKNMDLKIERKESVLSEEKELQIGQTLKRLKTEFEEMQQELLSSQNIESVLNENRSEESERSGQGQQEKVKLENISVEEYHFIKTIEEGDVATFMKMISIMIQFLSEAAKIEQNQLDLTFFKKNVSKLVQQVYCQIKTFDQQAAKELQQLFRQNSSCKEDKEQSIDDPQDFFKKVLQNLFQTIKKIQNIIDKQDLLQLSPKEQSQPNPPVTCGNLAIISYRLLQALFKDQPLSPITSLHTASIKSQEQFYIWLYQLQLQAMEQEQQQGQQQPEELNA